MVFLGFDELTDVMDTAQLFFIKRVSSADFEVTENLASMNRLHMAQLQTRIFPKKLKKH